MKTREIRKTLCKALARAEKGVLPESEARSIIGLANQIANSLAVEVKVATLKQRMGAVADNIGELDVAN